MAQVMLGDLTPEKQVPLSQDEVLRWFRSANVTNKLPFQPKGGQIFLFKPTSSTEKEDWKADGHRYVLFI